MKTGTWVKAAIINGDGQVLLLRRSKTDLKRPGELDFPGGAVDAGEDLLAAGSREIREETGITIPIAELKLVSADTMVYEDSDLNVNRLLLVGHIRKVDIKLSSEHDQYEWVDIDTAIRDFKHPFYGAGLRHARDNGLL